LAPDVHVYGMPQAGINTDKIGEARHQHVDGTAVAARIVSAGVAQMLEADPRLTPEQIRSMLCNTARPLADCPPERQGAGVIQAAAALAKVGNHTD